MRVWRAPATVPIQLPVSETRPSTAETTAPAPWPTPDGASATGGLVLGGTRRRPPLGVAGPRSVTSSRRRSRDAVFSSSVVVSARLGAGLVNCLGSHASHRTDAL